MAAPIASELFSQQRYFLRRLYNAKTIQQEIGTSRRASTHTSLFSVFVLTFLYTSNNVILKTPMRARVFFVMKREHYSSYYTWITNQLMNNHGTKEVFRAASRNETHVCHTYVMFCSFLFPPPGRKRCCFVDDSTQANLCIETDFIEGKKVVQNYSRDKKKTNFRLRYKYFTG